MKLSMNCEDIRSRIPGYLTGDLDAAAVESLQNHVSQCTACRDELEELTETWTQLGILPEEQPGPNLRKNFYTLLESYNEGLEARPLKKFLSFFRPKHSGEGVRSRRPAFQWAFAAIVLIVGFVSGYFFQFYRESKGEIDQLRRQNQQFQRELTLAMLSQSSPSQRLKGLACSTRLENPGNEILETLLYTLDNDPNINVRLSAIDALYLFAEQPLVKKGISESLQKQTSPLVQIALIDLMVDLREKQAVKSLKELLKNTKLNPEVKERARLSLEYLL